MGKSLLLLLLFLIISLGKSFSGEMLNDEELAKLSASYLFEHANQHLKRNHLDTAMGYYIVLAGKYDTGMDKTDKYLCVKACNAAGQIYTQKENYSKAFDLYLKGIRISEEIGFDDLLAGLYTNIGNIYSVFTDHQQAISYYKMALEYARKNGDKGNEIRILVNLSGVCCYENLTEEAKVYYDEMMKLAGKDSLFQYFGYLNKALILSNEKKYESAILCFEKSADYANRVKLEPRYTGSVYGELAKLYEKMGERDSAIYYSLINVAYTEENNLMYMLIESLKALARLYDEKGDIGKSLYYKDRYLVVSDSLFSMEKFNKMKNAQFIYEMDKNYQEISSLTTEKAHKETQIKTQKRLLIIISSGMLIFIIFLLIVYTQKRKLHLAYKDLFSRNNEILQSDLQIKELRAEYENKLAGEKMRYEKLEQQTRTLVTNTEPEEEKYEEVKLYSVNKLTDLQKENLISDINKIMETTDIFCDCDFSLERLAELIGSNSRYVSQIINETYNKNFRTFVNEYRIKEARLRLMNTEQYGNYTIKTIAESVGYKSHTSFIDIFKKTTGITPSIYQKLAKESK